MVFKNASEWLFFTAALALGILGNQLACGGYNTGWWLAIVRMLYFVPFYGLGILYRRKLEAYDRKISSFPYFTAVLAIKLILTIHCGHSPVYTISWCSDFTEGPVMPIVIGYLGIAFWMRMANLLEPLIGKSRWINLIADNTFSIMMNQFLGFMAVKSVYAALSKYAGFFSDFDQACYRTNIWYYYTPKGLEQSLILYTAAGILIPILIQKTIDLAKRTAPSKIKSRKVNIQS